MTKEQRIISDFLLRVYLESDSEEFDSWIMQLVIENGDIELFKAMRGNK